MGDTGEQLARLEGYYKVVGHRAQFLRVDGNTATLTDTHETFVFSTTISYGDFGNVALYFYQINIKYLFSLLGEAHQKIREKLKDHCKYNVKFTVPENLNKNATAQLYQLPIEYGVITDKGNNCYVEGQKIYQFVKLSNEEYEKMINDFDPIEAPPGPYTVQERQGSQLLFLCVVLK